MQHKEETKKISAIHPSTYRKKSVGIGLFRPTWAEVDLDAVRHNLRTVRSLVRPDTKILVVVKANAYGHGLVDISQTASECGADYLGVATIEEGLTLRRASIKTPILLLGSATTKQGPLDAALKNSITLTVYTIDLATALSRRAEALGLSHVPFHIKVDTGMGRIGLAWSNTIKFVNMVRNFERLKIEGIYTHFPSADDDESADFTNKQIEIFDSLLTELEEMRIDIPYRHAANSVGLVDFKQSHLSMVRPGILIYGIVPKKGLHKRIYVKPAMSLKTRIVYLKHVGAGTSISYGRTYRTKKATRIATIPIGYGDGYTRSLSNRAHVLIRGRRLPLIGRVTMDQCMIDVGGLDEVKVGDEVVLIGSQKGRAITAEEIAELADTIPYEIVCSLNDRIPRIYK